MLKSARSKGRFPRRRLNQLGRAVAESLEARTLLSVQYFTIDPTRSSLTASLSDGELSFTAQGSNPWGGDSLTTRFGGTLGVDFEPGTIAFTQSSTLTAETNGTWQPGDDPSADDPNNQYVALPADYGAVANTYLGPIWLAARGMVFQFRMPAVTLSSGSFSTSSLAFDGSTGAVFFDGLEYGEITITGEQGNDQTGAATYTVSNGVGTLTVPIYSPQTYFDAGNDTTLSVAYTGQIVATSGPVYVQSVAASSNPVTVGGTTTLTASGVTDSAGSISTVNFYQESNGQPGLQTGSGGDTLVGSTSTGSGGNYSVTVSTAGLTIGDYSYYAQAIDNNSLASLSGVNAAAAYVVVQPVSTGSITGSVFNDANNNGIKDSGELGIAGWTVFLDLQHDGKLDLGDPSTTTDSNGNFTFSNLAPGRYDIAEQLQPGYVQSTPAGSVPAVVLASEMSAATDSDAAVSVPVSPSYFQYQYIIAHPTGTASPDYSTATPMGLTPSQIRHAYGFDQVTFGATAGNGAGQTIAIIDAYDDPTISYDLTQFDNQFGLPAPPSFTKVAQEGSSNYPETDPAGQWEGETALDVEWAHAIAPGANIILVEANDDTTLDTAISYARTIAGVSVISMSFGESEYSSEISEDSTFTTPAGHVGETFVAASGDSGAYVAGSTAFGYPAASPDVLGVGGTSLTLDGSGNYSSETAWIGSGGGVSQYESEPTYQVGTMTQSYSERGVPDVAFDADPYTGVAVYDSYSNGSTDPWVQVGGTSLGTPAWAALVAIVDQGLAIDGKGSLDGGTQTIPDLYQLPASDFHDITTGNNGYPAAAGYDLDTGRGSPIANQLIPDMVNNVGAALAGETGVILTTQNTSSSGNTFGVFHALVAANDSAVTSGNTAVTINVLSNDTDAVGAINPASVAAVSNPSDGSLSINSSNGQITYTPVAGFFGTDSFTYNFKDNNGLTSNTATVSVNVNPTGLVTTAGTTYSVSGTPSTFNVTAGSITLIADLSTQFPGYVLIISNGAKVTLAAAQHMGGFQIPTTGTLDIGKYHLFVNYGSSFDPIYSIAGYIKNGYNGNQWNGTGIMSTNAQTSKGSYGIGYADSADSGNPAGLATKTIEIKYTLLGDANLDGKVNGTDFTILATNFNQSVTNAWDKGDFNYDGKVNGTDFLALAANFNQSANQSAVSPADSDAVNATAAATLIPVTALPPTTTSTPVATSTSVTASPPTTTSTPVTTSTHVTTSNTSTAENPVPRTTFAAAGAPPSTLAPISDDGSNDVNAAILNHRGKKKTSH
jgi:hypothetical protein